MNKHITFYDLEKEFENKDLNLDTVFEFVNEFTEEKLNEQKKSMKNG